MATESSELKTENYSTAKQRAVWVLLALFLTIALMVSLAPHMIEKTGFKAIVLEKLGASTGMRFQADGALELRTLPAGQISMAGVYTASPIQTIGIKAAKVTSDFAILPLLFGKLSVNAVTFHDAEIVVNLTANAAIQSDAPSPLVTLISGSAAGGITALPPESVACVRCTVIINGAGRSELRLENFNGRWNWAGGVSSASLAADFNWRGEPVALNFAADNLEDLRNGLPTRVVSEFTARLAKFSFDGQSNLAANLFAEGQLTFDASSMKEFLAWSEPGATAGETIDTLSLKANLNAKDGKMLLSDMALTTAGALATGVFELDLTGTTPKTSGTLAFESVELRSLLNSLPLGFDRGAHLSQLDKIDLDLRLSAKTAKIGKYEIANAAGAVKIRDGSADLDLGTGEFGGGTVQSRLSVEGSSQLKTGKFSLNFYDLNAESLSSPETGTPALAAPVNIKIEAAGPYTNARLFVEQANGTIEVDAASGILRNFSMDTFLKSVAEGSAFELSDTYAGMSEIEKVKVLGRIRKGLVLVDSASITVGGGELRLVGIIPLADRGFGLSGQILGNANTAPNTNFFIGGSWNRPVVTMGPTKK